VRLLLDTHAVVWWVFGNRRLSASARTAIERTAEVFVSAVSAYEIARKHAAGRWPDAAAIAHDVAGVLLAEDFVALPVTLAHAEAAGRLPPRHRDPFDRLLAAQALREGLTLVSADPAFDAYGVPRLW